MTSTERRSSRLQEAHSSAGETQDFFNQLNTQSQHQSQTLNLPQSKPQPQPQVTKAGIYLNSYPLILLDINVKFMQFRISELIILLDKLPSWDGTFDTFFSCVHRPLIRVANQFDFADVLLGITVFIPPHGSSCMVHTYSGEDQLIIEGAVTSVTTPPSTADPSKWFTATHAYVADDQRFQSYKNFSSCLKGTFDQLVQKNPTLLSFASEIDSCPSIAAIYRRLYQAYQKAIEGRPSVLHERITTQLCQSNLLITDIFVHLDAHIASMYSLGNPIDFPNLRILFEIGFKRLPIDSGLINCHIEARRLPDWLSFKEHFQTYLYHRPDLLARSFPKSPIPLSPPKRPPPPRPSPLSPSPPFCPPPPPPTLLPPLLFTPNAPSSVLVAAVPIGFNTAPSKSAPYAYLRAYLTRASYVLLVYPASRLSCVLYLRIQLVSRDFLLIMGRINRWCLTSHV